MTNQSIPHPTSQSSTSSNATERKQGSNSDATQDLQEQLHQLRADLVALRGTAIDAGAQGLRSAKEAASDQVERGKEKLGESRDELESWVRDHPLRAVAIAAGVGALWGLMTGRR